ncbi:MAG TPA: DUF2203 domain-containing protein [Chthonomonadales bacterium]|nr:DUF2203 domain-containing protein [Chthonomonadales bacterium]
MAQFERYFTLAEARSELPDLKRIFERVLQLLSELQAAQVELKRARSLIQGNGHAVSQPELHEQLRQLEELLGQVTSRGIEIKDLARGLVDFPHRRNGEEVYLCWMYGEEDITHWHTLEGGFAARQPL